MKFEPDARQSELPVSEARNAAIWSGAVGRGHHDDLVTGKVLAREAAVLLVSKIA